MTMSLIGRVSHRLMCRSGSGDRRRAEGVPGGTLLEKLKILFDSLLLQRINCSLSFRRKNAVSALHQAFVCSKFRCYIFILFYFLLMLPKTLIQRAKFQ